MVVIKLHVLLTSVLVVSFTLQSFYPLVSNWWDLGELPKHCGRRVLEKGKIFPPAGI
jgi:hypothetical protein